MLNRENFLAWLISDRGWSSVYNYTKDELLIHAWNRYLSRSDAHQGRFLWLINFGSGLNIFNFVILMTFWWLQFRQLAAQAYFPPSGPVPTRLINNLWTIFVESCYIDHGVWNAGADIIWLLILRDLRVLSGRQILPKHIWNFPLNLGLGNRIKDDSRKGAKDAKNKQK